MPTRAVHKAILNVNFSSEGIRQSEPSLQSQGCNVTLATVDRHSTTGCLKGIDIWHQATSHQVTDRNSLYTRCQGSSGLPARLIVDYRLTEKGGGLR